MSRSPGAGAGAPGTPLRFALSKGRIFDETLPLLEAAGLAPVALPAGSRQLVVPSEGGEVEFLIVRASDVPTYVQHGGAALGVVGKDVLMEHGGEGLLEPVDLRIARCRLMTAGHAPGSPGADDALLEASGRRLRVATKFPRCARRHFAAAGRQVEIVKLYGSMELAPIVGLADVIVDVVDTGGTLRANGLVPLETLAQVSARLVVNRALMKVRHAALADVVGRIAAAVDRAAGTSPVTGGAGARAATPPVLADTPT